MMQNEFIEIKKSWTEVAKNNSPESFSFELAIADQLLNIFHAGNFYYYIFNCATAQIEFVSESVKNILGFNRADELTTEYLVSNMHPDDQPFFFKFETKVVEFLLTLPPEKVMKYKMSYDYRVRKKNGDYIRILQQSLTIQSDENGAVIRVLGIHTDITNIKRDGTPALAYLGLDGEPDYYHTTEDNIVCLQPLTDVFTKREKEVLKLLVKGKTSNEIANELFISKLTVDVHRRNLLRKANVTSAVELAIKVMQLNFDS